MNQYTNPALEAELADLGSEVEYELGLVAIGCVGVGPAVGKAVEVALLAGYRRE